MRDFVNRFGVWLVVCLVSGLTVAVVAYGSTEVDGRMSGNDLGVSPRSDALEAMMKALAPSTHEPTTVEECNQIALDYSNGNQALVDAGLYGENQFFEAMQIGVDIERDWQLCLTRVGG